MKPAIPSRRGRPSVARLKGPPSTRSYATLPSLTEWQMDTRPGRSSRGADMRANDPVLRTIDELVKELGTAEDGAYLYLLGQLFFSTMYWMNHRDRDPRMIPECRKPILSLNLFAANEFARLLDWPHHEIAARMKQLYGINMSEHGVDTDTPSEKKKYHDAGKRELYRVFFLQGRGYHYRLKPVEKGLPPRGYFKALDSCFSFNSGRPGFLFVLSMSNELYVGLTGFHSHFLAGRDVQCAGTMQFEKGIVTHVKNDSGHYAPVDLSLVKVLHLLRMNGMDLSRITVDTVVIQDGKGVEGPSAPGHVFMQQQGNWSAILKRAPHQVFRRA